MKTIRALAWSAADTSPFDAAALLAREHGALLIGVAPPSFRAVPLAWAEVGMGAAFEAPMASDEQERAWVESLHQAFDARMKAAGLGRPSQGDISFVPAAMWRAPVDGDSPSVGVAGRTADLLVVPQPGGASKMPETLFEDALFESGRPVLVVPPGPRARIGGRVAISWNASTESARTTALAMPILRRAEAIEVIGVDGAMVAGPSAEDLAVSLRRHGLPVTARQCPAGTKPAGQTLVDAATAFGADLIVKGAYTQSRLRQLIFGGVTRHLILSSPVPVLFAH